MKSRSVLPALTLACCAFVASPGGAAGGGSGELKTTIELTRELGTAMFSWLNDQEDPPAGAAASDTFEWTQCPAIGLDEAAALLEPAYLKRMPRSDGWGHSFELCLRRTGAGLVIGIRSPGRDGRFDGTTYQAGAFDPAELDRDVVWIDGYFVRWPELR